MEKENIVFLVSRRTGTRGVSLSALPGQVARVGRVEEEISESLAVSLGRKKDMPVKEMCLRYPSGTVFATEKLKRCQIGYGSCYAVDELKVVSEEPVTLFDAPSNCIVELFKEFIQ